MTLNYKTAQYQYPNYQNRSLLAPDSDFGGFHLTWHMLTGIDPMTWTDRAHVLQLVTDVRSPHNHIRVADVSPRAAGHPLAGARLLLLDDPGNIHSLSFPRCARRCPLTATYLDAFATLPPLLSCRPRLRRRLRGPRAPPLPPGPLRARLGARPRRPGRRPRLLRPRRAELEKDHVAPELKGEGTREAEGLTTNSFWGLI